MPPFSIGNKGRANHGKQGTNGQSLEHQHGNGSTHRSQMTDFLNTYTQLYSTCMRAITCIYLRYVLSSSYVPTSHEGTYVSAISVFPQPQRKRDGESSIQSMHQALHSNMEHGTTHRRFSRHAATITGCKLNFSKLSTGFRASISSKTPAGRGLVGRPATE